MPSGGLSESWPELEANRQEAKIPEALKYQLELVPSGDIKLDRTHNKHVPLTTKPLSDR